MNFFGLVYFQSYNYYHWRLFLSYFYGQVYFFIVLAGIHNFTIFFERLKHFYQIQNIYNSSKTYSRV